MKSWKLKPGKLTHEDLQYLQKGGVYIALPRGLDKHLNADHEFLLSALDSQAVYGVNHGFGDFDNFPIGRDDWETLQRNLIFSHSCGVGKPFSKSLVRLILILKINTLAQGYSGVRPELVHGLTTLYNEDLLPLIPSQGSVGASGDLAPLAHMASVLLGHGHVMGSHEVVPASAADFTKIILAPKEGLALINGLQVSTALAWQGAFELEQLIKMAILVGSFSTLAVNANQEAFDKLLNALHDQKGQQQVNSYFNNLLKGCAVKHTEGNHIQAPYSIRCQPQVMGACWDQWQNALDLVLREVNGISDNPIVHRKKHRILSGGNFHGEAIAFAADNMALALAELGSLSERRIALLMDAKHSGLPAFLTQDPGLNCGFMMAQVTAASLVSENKALAHPLSVDSIPTSGDQEDHVSMACYAARRLHSMAQNCKYIVAIELLVACQGMDMQEGLSLNPSLKAIHDLIRSWVPPYNGEHLLSDDINTMESKLFSESFQREIKDIMD